MKLSIRRTTLNWLAISKNKKDSYVFQEKRRGKYINVGESESAAMAFFGGTERVKKTLGASTRVIQKSTTNLT